MKINFTPRAVYRGQIEVLERRLKANDTTIADLRTQINTQKATIDSQKAAIASLNDDIKRVMNESSQRQVISKNIIDDQRKKLRNFEKEVKVLRDELGRAYDEIQGKMNKQGNEPQPEMKPKFTRAKNGRFAKREN